MQSGYLAVAVARSAPPPGAGSRTFEVLLLRRLYVNKKLLAVAVATAFAAPVAMAQTNVTIYGSFNPTVGWAKASDATDGTLGHGNRMRIGQLGGSHIGFRGSEALGGGLSVVWQVEQNIGLDGTGGTNTWGSRDTFVGLSGGFGTVTWGHISTPFATLLSATVAQGGVFGAVGPTGATAIMTNATLPGGPFATTAGYAAAFFRRQESSIQYVSPTFNGFTARLLVSANEAKANSAGAIPSGAGAMTLPAGTNPYIWSASLTYAAGPFLAGFVFDRHNDLRVSGTRTLDNEGWMLAGRWTSGPFMVAAAYRRFTYEVFSGGVTQDLTSSAWMLNGQYSTGPHRFRIGYGEQGAGSSITGVGANASLCVGFVCASNSNIVVGAVTHTGTKSNQFNIGYGYALSKRSELFAFYSRLANNPVARVNLVGGDNPILPGAGSDITTFGAGIRHSF
jgi:predicted porin